jgi:hypothetical protein
MKIVLNPDLCLQCACLTRPTNACGSCGCCFLQFAAIDLFHLPERLLSLAGLTGTQRVDQHARSLADGRSVFWGYLSDRPGSRRSRRGALPGAAGDATSLVDTSPLSGVDLAGSLFASAANTLVDSTALGCRAAGERSTALPPGGRCLSSPPAMGFPVRTLG